VDLLVNTKDITMEIQAQAEVVSGTMISQEMITTAEAEAEVLPS
jgi:hypothetical protein